MNFLMLRSGIVTEVVYLWRGCGVGGELHFQTNLHKETRKSRSDKGKVGLARKCVGIVCKFI